MIDDKYKDFTREQLVEEYLSIRLATLVNAIGTDWHWMPTDVPQSAEYWKMVDGNLHEMHKRIAELYHIDRYDCLWLENIVDSDNLYITNRKFKPLLKQAIDCLERKENEVLKNEKVS